MSTKDESENPEKRTRRIVRSASTRRENEGGDSPAAAPTPAEAPAAAAPEATAAAPAAAPAAGPAAAPAAAAPKPAPAQRPAGAGAPGPRPGGPRGPGRGGPGGPGPRRPPRLTGAQAEEGMRPRPGPNAARSPMGSGPRPPRPARPEGEARPEGDRPAGARPGGGEGRGPRPPRQFREGGPRPEGRGPRPPRQFRDGPRPEGARPPAGKDAPPAAAAAKPAAKPAAPPAPKPAAPAAKPAPEPKKSSIITILAPKPVASGGKTSAPKPALTPKEALSAKAKAAQAKQGKPQPTEAAAAPAPAEAQAAPAFEPADLTAGWDAALEAARKAGDRAAALVDAWLAGSNAEAIAAVADADQVPAVARKAARRAVGILKSRGVTIPTKPRVARFDARAEVAVEATFLPPDASGTMALSITSRDASGRYHLAEVIVREPIGVLNAGSAWLSGSQLKEGRNRALEGLGMLPAPVPVEWARFRIAAAKKLNAASGQILPLGLEGCRELIDPAPEAEPAHPVADLEAAVTSELAWARAPGSASLHEEPEFRTWLPDRPSLEELLQRLGQRLGPDGLRDQEAVNKALGEEIEAATDRFFSPEMRAMLAGRMRDSAISVRTRKGNERASDVLAVARAIREAGLITSPPREIPFLVGFFQKGISYLAQQGGGSLRIPMAAGQAPAGGEVGNG